MKKNMTAPWRGRIIAHLAGWLAPCLAGAIPTIGNAAHADDASAWQRERYAAVRLIAGSRTEAGTGALLAGIEIALESGWKTYWRTPGDSGVPPRFDFARSDNVASVAVLFPAPEPFPDGAGGTSFGYHNRVYFPLRIAAQDPTKPVTLRANIAYAVCEKLCVPLEANAELVIADSISAHDSALHAALERVPKPMKIGDPAPIALRAIRAEVGSTPAKPPVVIADVAAPPTAAITLFVEGPTGEWALPAPTDAGRTADGLRRFRFALDGAPPGTALRDATLRLTLTGATSDRFDAYEYSIPLTAHLPPPP